MWNAMRWALFGPMLGSRPSPSIRSWTTPSYTSGTALRMMRSGAPRRTLRRAARSSRCPSASSCSFLRRSNPQARHSAAHAAQRAERSELVLLQLLGLFVGRLYRGDDQVGQRLGVLRVGRFGGDLQVDQLAEPGDGGGDQAAAGGSGDLAFAERALRLLHLL